jgi:hypothetical protein
MGQTQKAKKPNYSKSIVWLFFAEKEGLFKMIPREWLQNSTKPSRFTAGLFYALFVLELCSDKKGHKKNLNKIEVLWNLGGERGIRTPVSFH